MPKSRHDYIITNRVCINSLKEVVKNDFQLLNSKYAIIIGLNNELNHSIKTEVVAEAYLDGFSLGFDLIGMK